MSDDANAHLRPDDDMLLRVEDLVVEYTTRGRTVQAVSGVSFDIAPGEVLGLVGESGCGKSSLGRTVMMMHPATNGSITFDGRVISGLDRQAMRPIRPGMQMIFQDPASSLNPRRRIRDVVSEGLSITNKPRPWDAAIHDALTSVGLAPDVVGNRRPGQLSGGQCQRVAIARALLLNPKLLVCDEPVSSLDVSVQAQILNLLEDLRESRALTMLFIAHDLAVVKNISDRVAVMYLGKLCEIAPSDTLYRSPAHPYTHALLDSIPEPDPREPLRPPAIGGDLPSPASPPSGCRFRTRCPRAESRCAEEVPDLRQIAPDHSVACHFPLEVPTETVLVPAASVSLTRV